MELKSLLFYVHYAVQTLRAIAMSSFWADWWNILLGFFVFFFFVFNLAGVKLKSVINFKEE